MIRKKKQIRNRNYFTNYFPSFRVAVKKLTNKYDKNPSKSNTKTALSKYEKVDQTDRSEKQQSEVSTTED